MGSPLRPPQRKECSSESSGVDHNLIVESAEADARRGGSTALLVAGVFVLGVLARPAFAKIYGKRDAVATEMS